MTTKAIDMHSTTQATPLPTLAAAAGEHPFLLCRRADFAALQARAARTPWREMNAAALEATRDLRFAPTAVIRARAVTLARIFSTAALAYILDPANRARYIARIVDHVRHFAPGEPGSLLDEMHAHVGVNDWNQNTPTGNAYFHAVLALDVVHDDVAAADLARVEAILRDGPARYFAEQNLSWRQGSLAARAIWPIYRRDAAAAAPVVAAWHGDVLKHLSDDGVFTGGTGYADGRWTYQDREHKALFGEVLAHAGLLPGWYAERKVVAFQEWFNGYAFTPFRVCWPFGDSAPEQHKPRYQQGPERAYRYSKPAGGYAAWLTERQVPPAGLGAYVLTESFGGVPLASPSRVFPDGGAWLKEASLDRRSLAAVLWNLRTDTDLHAHKETNAVCVAAYGELLLRNAGYNGWNTTDHGFSWAYINDRAIAANTVLFDYAVPTTAAEDRDPSPANDHVSRGGAGITASLLTGVVDWARGESGAAIPNGRHARALIFVHPADRVGGYWIVLDDFAAPGCKTAHVVWHPNSDRHVVNVPRERYTWTADEFAGRDVGLTIVCATVPRDVAIREGVLANWTHGKVGTYLVADHALDARGAGRAMTVLFPHDAAHRCATFERTADGLITVRQGEVTDHLFTSDGTTPIAIAPGVTAIAQAGLFRRTADGTVTTTWLVGARSFEIAGLAFAASDAVTLCFRAGVMHVRAERPTTLTLRGVARRRPTCDDRVLDVAEGGVTVTIDPGDHRLNVVYD